MKLTHLAVTAPTVALLLSACGGGETPDASAPTAKVTETVTAPAAADATVTVTETVTAPPGPAPEETKSAEPTSDDSEPAGEGSEGQASFGETWTWEDGTEVTVSKPEPFQPGEYAFGGEGYDDHVKFTVTVQNGTGEALDLSLFYMTMQSGRSEAEEVFDSDSGMEGSPSTTLLDGRSVDFTAGFGVEDPDDLVLELTPSFDHDAAIFTN